MQRVCLLRHNECAMHTALSEQWPLFPICSVHRSKRKTSVLSRDMSSYCSCPRGWGVGGKNRRKWETHGARWGEDYGTGVEGLGSIAKFLKHSNNYLRNAVLDLFQSFLFHNIKGTFNRKTFCYGFCVIAYDTFPFNGVQRFATGFEACLLLHCGCVGGVAQFNNKVGQCFNARRTTSLTPYNGTR